MMQSEESQAFKANILIVDDTPANLQLLSDILFLRGYLARTVSSGQMAIVSIQSACPDLILLDIMMPEMSGFEVCRQLKADERTRHIPIIFISALEDVGEKMRAFELGGVDYITKPFQPGEVIARIETHLTLRSIQHRLQEKNKQLEQEIAERKHVETVLQQRNDELLLLNRLSHLFSSSLELEHLLEIALKEVQRLLDVDSTSFWLIDPDPHEIVCQQIIGPGSDQLKGAHLPLGQGITGWVAQHGESVLSADILADERHYTSSGSALDTSVRSMLSIPLRVKQDVIGVLNLVDPRVNRFTQQDLRFAELIAATAAGAIENARLYSLAQQELAERKRAETALQQANRELKWANESKDKFFSIISHDLRAPFNALLGYTRLLVEQFENYSQGKVYHFLERIHTSAERLYALIENLLTWSRIQRGVMEYEPETLDLHDVVSDTVDLFLSRAEQKQILLRSMVAENTFVSADGYMLATILRNLISNALKFTESGGTVTIFTQIHDADKLEVSITDTGCGIPQSDQHKLFCIDQQYSQTGTAGETGTGLGLILCQELVERHGGKIWAESAPGKGAAFRFTLARIEGKAVE